MVPKVVGSIPIIRPKKFMKYYYQTGVVKQKSIRGGYKIIVLALLLIAAAVYIGLTALTPALGGWPLFNPNQTAQMIQADPPVKKSYKLYIPKLNVVAGKSQVNLTGDPTSQDIVKILGDTFKLGVTPKQTKDDSPFYRLDQLRNGDNIFLDYHSHRYAYRVEKNDSNLNDGGLLLRAKGKKIIIKAQPIGTVAWRNGKAAINTAAF